MPLTPEDLPRYQGLIRHTLAALDPEGVEDLVQHVLASIQRRLADGYEVRSPAAFVSRVARNARADWCKAHARCRRPRPFTRDLPDPGCGPEAEVEFRDALDAALRGKHAWYRDIVEGIIAGRTRADIIDEDGYSRRQYDRAMRLLKQFLTGR